MTVHMIEPKHIVIVWALALAQVLLSSGPGERVSSDPKTVVSKPNAKAWPIALDDLYFSRSVAHPAWSPDGRELAFVCDLTGRYNIWKMPVAGGWPVQMVQSQERQFAPVWSRDGRWIIYQSDYGGAEYFDLFVIPSDGGAPTNLTKTEGISETIDDFSPDGQTLAFSYKVRSAPHVDLALMNWETRQVTKLTNETEPDRSWRFGAWSPDGSRIYAIRENIGFTDSDIYMIDVATGKAVNLTKHNGEAMYQVTAAAPSGKTLLITSNAKTGAHNVALLDVDTSKVQWVTDTSWEATSSTFTPDGKAFAYVVNADGRTAVYLAESATLKTEKLPFPEGMSFTAGKPGAFSPDGRYLLVSHQSSQRPADLWTFDLTSRTSKQVTFSAIATLAPEAIPKSQIVHYKSFDDKMISALLWMPFNLKRDGSHPGVVVPHGGPTGQTADTFTADVTALASRGYVVIAPNSRGSTGYGIEFQKANFQDLGGGDLKDQLHAAEFLVATGYVNPKKIGITGGSYGGFMTMMAIGRNPEKWAAAVQQFGVINWFTMMKHADPLLQEYIRSLLGHPVKDRKVYEDRSPLKYLRQATAPLLVLHGDNDIRVPKEEAEQAVRVLRTERRTVEAHYYPDEGHGFYKRENQIDATRRMLAWFDEYLKR